MAAVFKAAMDSLAETPCSKAMAKQIFAGYITPDDAFDASGNVIIEKGKTNKGEARISGRTKSAIEELTDLHVNGLGNRGSNEFDLLNSYTQYITRGAKDSTVPMGRRFASSEFGNGADSKADFVKVLTTERKDRFPVILDRGEKVLAVI